MWHLIKTKQKHSSCVFVDVSKLQLPSCCSCSICTVTFERSIHVVPDTDPTVSEGWKKGGAAVSVVCAALTAHSTADLACHESDLLKWIRQEVVWFQEVKSAERQQLKGDADVAVVVEPFQHLYTVAGKKKRVHQFIATKNMISVKINYQNYRRLTIYGVGLFHWFSPTHWFPVWQYFCISLGSLWSSRQFDVLLCGFKYSIKKTPHLSHWLNF